MEVQMKYVSLALVVVFSLAGSLLYAQQTGKDQSAVNSANSTLRYPAVDPDAYENDDTSNTAQAIQIYSTLHTQNHTIDSPPPAADLDWFRFYAEPGRTYYFWSTGSTNTGIGLLEDNGTTQLDSDDDSGDGNNFFLQFEPVSAGYYKLLVSGYAAGSYVFAALYTNADPFEPDDLPTQYTELALTPSAQTQAHTLHWKSDADWFGFQAEVGKLSIFLTTGFTNTSAWIYADDGVTLLASAESGGTESNFSLVFDPGYSGHYLLKIGSNSAAEVGPYLLSYRWGMLPDAYEPDDTIAQAYALDIQAAEQSQPRNLQSDTDQDWCAFTVQVGYTYSFWSTGSTDTQIWIHDTSGYWMLDYDDNDGEGSNFRLRYTATTNENLMLKIAGVSGSAGPYWFHYARSRTWGNDWVWAANAPGSGEVRASATDPISGCTYVTGSFTGAATFSATTLYDLNLGDIFIAKIDPAGNWLWAVRAGGYYPDSGTDIAVSSDGSYIYVSGYFQGAADFGPFALSSNGYYSDSFVAKLSSSGNWIWVAQAGGNGTGRAETLCLGSGGDIIVAGQCSAGTYFGTAYMAYNCKYIAKLFPDGNWFGAAPAVYTDNSGGNDMNLCAGSDGCFYLAAAFHGTAHFGSITLVSTATGTDTFVAKFDSNGIWQWAVDSNALGTCLPMSICFQGDACYLTGSYDGSTYFGDYAHLSGDNDVFVAKIDTAGNWIWAVGTGDWEYDYGYDICADANGVVVVGHFKGTAQFGAVELVADVDWGDVFAAKLNSSGNWIWATQAGGSGSDEAKAVSYHPASGKLSVAGRHTETCDFDAFSVTGSGFFVAQLSDLAAPPGTPLAPQNLDVSWYSVFDPWTHTSFVYEKVTWNPVTLDTNGLPLTPSYYNVYYADLPYITYSMLGTTTVCEFSRLLGSAHMPMPARGFYYIKAVAP